MFFGKGYPYTKGASTAFAFPAASFGVSPFKGFPFKGGFKGFPFKGGI